MSMVGSDTVGLTERDKQILGLMSKGEVSAQQLQKSGTGSVELPDPVDQPPTWDGDQNKYIDERISQLIYEHAVETSNREAAEYFGISERTIERHRSYWQDGEDGETPSFTGATRVTAPKCAVMRDMGHDGIPLSEIADRMGVAKRTAHRHVSSSEECQHETAVPRVDMGREVTDQKCDRMRRLARDGMTGPEIAQLVRHTRDTVNQHVSANRECSCDNEEEPINYDTE